MSGIIQSLIGSLKAGFSFFIANYQNAYVASPGGFIKNPTNDGPHGNQVAIDSSGTIYISGTYATGIYYGLTLTSISNTGSSVNWARIIGTNRTVSGCCGCYIWQTVIGGLTIDASGNVYLVGVTNNGDAARYGYLVKYDSSGTLQWQKKIIIAGSATYSNITICYYDSVNDCIYVIGGSRTDAIGADTLIKFDTSGTIVWSTQVSNYDSLRSITTDSSGNIYVAGTNGDASGYQYSGFNKLDSSGTRTLSILSYVGGGGSLTVDYGITVDSTGNIYRVGVFDYSGGGIYIIKTNSTGVIQWSRLISTSTSSARYYLPSQSIMVGSDGFIYICYQTGDLTMGWAKYNSSGTIQLQRTLTGDGTWSLQLGSDSNIYISGIYSGWILGNLPTDGSKTGTITVNGSSIIYRASTYTEQDAGFSAGTSTSTSSSTTVTASTASNTSSPITVTPYRTVL